MCGIVGVFGTPYSFQEVYQGLLLLQHRGQDAAGILSFDFNSKNFHIHKDLGLVSEVFRPEILAGFSGQMSVAHTRYATVGPREKDKSPIESKRDLQPMTINYPYGLGMVHNGNLINYYELKKYLLEEKKRHLFTNNDLEAMINILSDGLKEKKSNTHHFDQFKAAVEDLFLKAKGGYSVLGLVADLGLFAFRDPHGIRPLILGERPLSKEEMELHPNHFGKSYCLSSESNSLNFLGYNVVRDLAPGEILFIDSSGEIFSSIEYSKKREIPPKPCMFEWVYFANPESVIEERSVYSTRLEFGKNLAFEIKGLIDSGKIKPDLVVPIPETSRVAAISLSETLKIPYREVLIKNRYIQRSFILNTQESRNRAVLLKLTAIASEIKGKNILLLDDSIVRGTTSKRIIEMVKEAGANEVYFATTCPPVRYPCYYGVDFPDPKELVANGRTTHGIGEYLGADHLIYLSEEATKKSIGKESLCMSCVNGCYPVDISSAKTFQDMRSFHRE
ncbi:MAG: amidophosphoribosyltransferase [Bdellovibrionales bacterium]|nr:amidophosphoribosyltransferase [Bdellovibrionales bacterium]